MRFAAWIVFLLLLILVVVFALITLGAFASLSTGAPLWLRSFGSLEGAMYGQVGLGHLPGFTRALALTVLTSVLAGLAAYVKPRR